MKQLVTLIACMLACTFAAAAEQVWVVDLDDAVGPASVDLVIRAIDDAHDAGAQAIIIRMDTPGGLDKSMRDLVKAILDADLPVVTYVAPDGARAASAGTYIAFASHIAAMAPATNIGSSTPVSIAPQPPQPSGPSDPEQQGEPKPPAEDAMSRKVINDAVAYLQSLAELRERNVDWAELTVRDGANLRASEALANNVIDLIAADTAALLNALDGRTVELHGRTVTLSTKQATLVRVETDWRHELLTVITDPSVAYGLLIIGIYGLILEFYNPGTLFPAMVGVICLLLGAYGLQMLPVNFAGIALLVIGIGLMVAEVVTPTFGILGVGGLVAFVIGSVLLIDSDQPGYQIPAVMIAAFATVSGALAFFAVGLAIRARNRPVVTGTQTMIGAVAEALEDFQGEGTVRLHGEIWQAQCATAVTAGAHVTVTAIDGLILTVQAED